MALKSFNLATVAADILAGGTHQRRFGDSQTSEGPNYLWPAFASCALRRRWTYWVADGLNSSSVAPSRAFLSIGGIATGTNTGLTSSDLLYFSGGPSIVRAVNVVRFNAAGSGGNVAADTQLGQVNQINRICTTAGTVQQMPWPPCPDNSYKPWYHGSHIKAAMVWHDCPGHVGYIAYELRRAGASVTGSAGTRVQVSGLGAEENVVRTGWTGVVADAGTYDVVAGGYGNDHDLQVRMVASSFAYDEADKYLVPLAAIYARCDAGGTISFDANGQGPSWDSIYRSGWSVKDWLDQHALIGSTRLAEYDTATILQTNPILNELFMLGHNVEAADISGGVIVAQWRTDYEALINMRKAAFLAAFPTGTYRPLIIMPWFNTSGAGVATTALGNSMQAHLEAMCIANGWAFFSFYEAFGRVAPFPNLHPGSKADGELLALTLRDALDRETQYRYSQLGAVQRGISPLRDRSRG